METRHKGIWALWTTCQASDTESDSDERIELDQPCDLFYIIPWQRCDSDKADMECELIKADIRD